MQKLRAGMIVCIARTEEEEIRRDGLLGRRPLRRHVGDDDVQNPLQFVILEYKHLVIETSVPDKFLLLLFEVVVVRRLSFLLVSLSAEV